MKEYKFLKDVKFSNNRTVVINAKKDEKHEVADHIVNSLASQGAIKANGIKTPVEDRETKVMEKIVTK